MSKPKPTDSLRQRVHAVTAEAMLASAERAMVRYGYEKVTMQQIADETGCAPGTFYLYFKNKQMLLDAIIGRNMRVMTGLSRQAMAGSDDPLEKLRLMMASTLRYAEEHADVFRLVFSSMRVSHRELHERLDRIGAAEQEEFHGLILQHLREGQEKGLIRRDLPAETLHEFLDAVGFSFIERFSFATEKQSIDERLRLLWGLMTGGLVHQE